MDSPNDPLYHYNDIQQVLLTKLAAWRKAFPEDITKSIHVLTTVKNDVQDQLQLCLEQESNEHSGERIVLIPYYLGNSHYTGILLEFNANESIKTAEYIDPVKGIIPNKLQNQFKEVYPDHILHLKHLPKQHNAINSAMLTIENLLASANIDLSRITCGSSILPLTTDISKEGNENKLYPQLDPLKCNLESHNLQNIGKLQKETSDAAEKVSTSTALRVFNMKRALDEQGSKRSYIQDLRTDCTSMPPCAERTILELLIHFEEKQLEEEYIPLLSKDSEIFSLQKLQEQMIREQLVSDSIQKKIRELEIHVGNSNDSSVVACLNILLKRLRPLNVQEIERLVLKANQAAELIRGKDIILLLGDTGSGKSTMIQFLAGCKMIETEVEIAPERFLRHITANDTAKNPQLKNVVSCPFNRSETRYIAPVTVQLKDILGRHENGVLILCDAPGFGDTAGPEVDIANSLGVIEALQQSNSVKLLVLSSFKSLGDRGEGIQKLTHILVNMVARIENKFDSIFYAFTKYPSEIDIYTLLFDIKASKVDQDVTLYSDGAFVAVLSDMIKKTEYMKLKVNPILDQPETLINMLRTGTGIEHPEEVFRFPMSNDSHGTIDKHIQRVRTAIDCVMKFKDMNLVCYYLNNLKKLNDLLKQDEIQEVYDKCKSLVRDRIHEYCNELLRNFTRIINSQDRLKKDDIQDYKTAAEYVQQTEVVKEHLGLSLSSSIQLKQNIDSQLKARRIVLQDEELHSPLIGIYLENFFLLKNSFKEFEQDYYIVCQEYEKRFEELVKYGQESILTNDFKSIAEILLKISKAAENLKTHMHESSVEKCNNIIKSFLRHLNQYCDQANVTLAKFQISFNDIKILQGTIEVLRSAKETYTLRELISKYLAMHDDTEEYCLDLDNMYEQFLNKIIECFEKFTQRIADLIEKNEDHPLNEIHKIMQNIDNIHKIPEVQIRTVKSYYSAIESIRQYMSQLQRDARQCLYTIDQQSENINFKELERPLSLLQNTQWMNNIAPGSYEIVMHQLTEEFIEFARQLEHRLTRLDLSLKYPDHVRSAKEIMEKIEHLCSLQCDSQELVMCKKRMLRHILDRLQFVFDTIVTDFDRSDETGHQEIIDSRQFLESRSLITSSNSQSSIDVNESSYLFVEQQPILESIKREKKQLLENIEKLKSYVNEYENILYGGGPFRAAFKVVSRTIHNSVKEKPEATNYLLQKGYHNIDALKRTIMKFIAELGNLKKQEKLFSTSQTNIELNIVDHQLSSANKVSIKRRKFKPTNGLVDKSRLLAANNALIFFQNCQQIYSDPIRQIANDATEIVNNYLDEFIHSLEQKINEAYECATHIENYRNKNSSKYSQDIEVRLQALAFLSKFSLVFERVNGQEILQSCRQQYYSYYDTLKSTMEHCKLSGQSRELRDCLLIAQTLSCVDRFFEGNFLLNGYGALHKQYQVELIKDCEQALSIVLDCIEKREYDNVDIQLSHIDEKLVNPLHFAHIKYGLQSSLHKLMNDIEYDVNNLEEKLQKDERNRHDIQNLKNNIDKIRFVLKKSTIMEVQDEHSCNRLQGFLRRIDKVLSIIFLNNIESIEILLDTDAFSEAQQSIDVVTRLHRELADYCTSDEVSNKLNMLNERLNNIVPEILKRYDFADVFSYAHNLPKTIFKKLETMASLSGAKYEKVYRDLSQITQRYLMLAIDNVRACPLAERARKIHSLDNASQYLPNELRDQFQSQLNDLQNDLTNRESAYKQQLEMCLTNVSDNDHLIEKLGELAKEYQKEKLDELLNQLRREILKEFHIYQTRVRTFLEEHNLPNAFDTIKKIFKYKECLGHSIPEIEEISHTVTQLIRRSFLNCCQTLSDISSIEQTSTVETAFNDIVVYLHSSEMLDKKVIVLFPDDILRDAQIELEKMFQYLQDIEKQFRIALNRKNIYQLHQVLIISKKWNSFLEKINRCQSKHLFIQNFLIFMKNIILYKDMIDEVEKLVHALIDQVNGELINDDTIKFEVKRDELYTKLAISMNLLRIIASELNEFVPSLIDIDELEKLFERKIEKIISQLLEKSLKEELSLKDADEFRIYYTHLVSFDKHVLFSKTRIRQVLEASEEKIITKVVSLREQIVTDKLSATDIAQLLIKMKFFAENLSMFDKRINVEIDEALKIYKNQHGMLSIMALVVELEKFDSGPRLMSEHSCLNGESWRRRRSKMQKQDDIDYVLRELSGDSISLQILRTRYESFRNKYDELVKENLKLIDSTASEEIDVGVLVTQIKFMVGSVTDTSKEVSWKYALEQKIPELLAYIFAVWTLKNTYHYNTARGIEAAQSYLLIPHAGQVIAVFRLLGIGYTPQTISRPFNAVSKQKISDNLVNNLVEIGTGEGKSAVMAIAACVFALTGIDVNCSCYSEVLSTRDRDDFASVFKALGIADRIKYGTFDRLCEQFINEKCNIRHKVSNMITNNKNILPNNDRSDGTKKTRPQVLLIDEVDVFLSDRFYGGTYRPAVVLNDPPIRALLASIWQKKASITSNEVMTLPAYQTCANQYSHWIFIFDEAIKDMLAALRSFKNSTYIVRNNKICYVRDESVVGNLIYGYNTMWAYYDEYEKGNITEHSLEENVGLLVHCGDFSYAEMPHDFAYIAGVTGTLKTLAKSERDILTNVYQIHEHTFLPSVFAKNNRTYKPSNHVEVVDESQYFLRIRGEIDAIRQSKRAILIFFKSQEALTAFYNSAELSSLKEDVQLITEKVGTKDRELSIKRAASVEKVTLMTRIFGRGTDFICDDPIVLANGGIHVLQTFFSEELAEEYQIMGRSARQGDRGSYRMILLDKDLEWVFGLTWKDELRSIQGNKLYEIINTARNSIYESKCLAKNLSLEQHKREHKVSKDFTNALWKGNIKTVKRFLTKRNKGIDLINDSSRTLILISGTSVLSPLLSSIKEMIGTIFERASIILEEKDLSSDIIQMQIAVYRGYTFRANEILEFSSWYIKGSDLREFLDTIDSTGGGSENAIEIGLQHAVKESKTRQSISQIILIGDTPANNKQEIEEKRDYLGEAYWKKTPFDRSTDYIQEIESLRDQEIPIHTFYLSVLAKDSFQKIAAMTGGRCEQLNISSSRGAELFAQFVTEEVLRKAAGAEGDAAVQLYRANYVR
ncbi:unnamed protein product [Adineta steineri]|uniref:Uncharacterized protein n=1 Tax=Adineta steineri TaxID=433720 RepID=A0A819NH10_9BILA|nr:unnamed protein product [Adineta steineri]CAF3995954.1 unnamed protein product [Adineta steineri]